MHVSIGSRIARTFLLVGGCLLAATPCIGGTELADAVMQRDAAQVDRLLRAGRGVHEAQADGSTALHWAAHHGDARTVARLLRAGADPAATTDTGITPLILACQAGAADVVRLLLDAGAGPGQALANGETPLMMAARTGDLATLRLLLDRGAEVDAREKLRGTTALMWAAANGNTDAAKLLVARGADVSARSAPVPPGRRPYLAPPGRERIVEFIEGTGLVGAILEQNTADTVDPGVDPDDPDYRAKIAERNRKRIAAAKEILDRLEEPPPYARRGEKQFGGLTPLLFAVREGDIATVNALLDAGADVNQTSEYGWTPLLAATQNRYYRLGMLLLERGADPNIANEGGWNALYLATDNRNIEAGDYPTRRPDMDHLEFIRALLARGANPNLRMRSSTETRTIFTHQWLYEEGATPFLRAAQSGDLVLMKLLLEHGADPHIPTDHNVTPLMVASGIGWVEGVTWEWSKEQTLEAVKLLLELGADVNAQDVLDGRTALMGAAHKGRNDVIELLVAHGADLAIRDIGSRDSIHQLAGITWQAIDYADGLVRVGVQSAIAHPETSTLLRRLMKERGLPVPPEGRTLASICITEICR